MLVLSRKAGEKLVIGDNVEITVSKISGNRVTVAIDAPREVAIRRGELVALAGNDVPGGGSSDAASLHVAAYHA